MLISSENFLIKYKNKKIIKTKKSFKIFWKKMENEKMQKKYMERA